MPQEVAGQPQDLVMTLFGAYVHPRDRPVWSGGLVTLLGELGISPGAARVSLTRLAARNMLARLKNGRRVSYTTTPRSAAVLHGGDERIFSLGRASRPEHEEWTVLWHTIPEARRLERGRLTRRLRFLGFGPVQDGTWIVPRDRAREVRALLDELGVREHAGLMLARPAAPLDFAGFITRVWGLEELAERYRGFVHEFGRYQADSVQDDIDDRQAWLMRTRLIHAFRRFPSLDPELPEDLVPAPQHRPEAVRLFHDLYAALAPPAQRHFDEVTTP